MRGCSVAATGCVIVAIDNTAWHQEVAGLTKRLARFFAEASPTFQPPDSAACYSVATAIMVVRDRAEGRLEREGNDPCGKALGAAQVFLKHAATAQTALAVQLEVAETFAPSEAEAARAAVERLREAVRAMNAVRDDLKFRPPPDLDDIRFVANAAREAWAGANGGKAPDGQGPKGPMVKFLVAAFKAGGTPYKPATVSDVLRGRRRTVYK